MKPQHLTLWEKTSRHYARPSRRVRQKDCAGRRRAIRTRTTAQPFCWLTMPGCGPSSPDGTWWLTLKTGLYGGGLTGMEQHYLELSERFGYPIGIPEMTINILGYQLLSLKRVPEAVDVFERYAQLYPESANAYDSLGEGLEAAGKLE